MRADRQTTLYSATWPKEVSQLSQRLLLPGAITIEVGGALTDGGKANVSIVQQLSITDEAGKMGALVRLLEKVRDTRARGSDWSNPHRI